MTVAENIDQKLIGRILRLDATTERLALRHLPLQRLSFRYIVEIIRGKSNARACNV